VLAALSEEALAALADPDAARRVLERRPTPWFDRALVPLFAARFGGPPYRGFLDVPNAASAIAGVGRDAVVELPVRVDPEIDVAAPMDMPAPILAFLGAIGNAEDLAYRAARDRDPSLLAAALRALPLPLDEAHIGPLVDAALAPPPPLPEEAA